MKVFWLLKLVKEAVSFALAGSNLLKRSPRLRYACGRFAPLSPLSRRRFFLPSARRVGQSGKKKPSLLPPPKCRLRLPPKADTLRRQPPQQGGAGVAAHSAFFCLGFGSLRSPPSQKKSYVRLFATPLFSCSQSWGGLPQTPRLLLKNG